MSDKTRRLSSGNALKKKGKKEEDDGLEENDDEAELRELEEKRRKLTKSGDTSDDEGSKRGSKKRKSEAITPATAADKDDGFVRPGAPLQPKTPKELAELYDRCLKLCSENKINAKNAWALPLINYIDNAPGDEAATADASQAGGEGAGKNFQRASVALDASVKIYSVRVDSLHHDTYKTLGGLSRADGKDDDGDEAGQANGDGDGGGGEGGEGGYQEDEKKEKKKRAKADRAVNTLEPNVANLNAKKIDLEFSVDPLFRKTSAAFDEGGARGLLLNHLTVQSGCEIIFDSSDAANVYTAVPADFVAPGDELDLGEIRQWISAAKKPKTDAGKLRICPAYAAYRFSSSSSARGELEDVALDNSDDEAPFEEGADVDRVFASQDDVRYDGGDGNQLSQAERILEMENIDAAFPLAQPIDSMGVVGDADFDGDDGMVLDLPADGEDPEARAADAKRYAQRFAVARDAMFDNVDESDPLARDYVYFDTSKANQWAGPQCWKVSRPKAATTSTASKKSVHTEPGLAWADDGEAIGEEQGEDKPAGEEKKSRKRKGEAFFFDFFTGEIKGPKPKGKKNKDKDDEELKPFDKQIHTKGTNTAPLGSAKLTILAQSGTQAEAPQPRELQSPFLRPGAKVEKATARSNRQASAAQGTDHMEVYDSQLAADTQAPGHDGGDSDNDGGFDAGGFMPAGANADWEGGGDEPDAMAVEPGLAQPTGAEGAAAPGQAFGGGMALVQAPKKLRVEAINYAKVDKRVDVKALKRSIWTELCTPADGSPATEAMTEEKDWKEVLEALPRSVDAATMREASVPYCFVCLLHLANEKHLELVQDGIQNLVISQTPPRVQNAAGH